MCRQVHHVFFIGNLRFSFTCHSRKGIAMWFGMGPLNSHVFCEVVVLSTVLCFGMAWWHSFWINHVRFFHFMCKTEIESDPDLWVFEVVCDPAWKSNRTPFVSTRFCRQICEQMSCQFLPVVWVTSPLKGRSIWQKFSEIQWFQYRWYLVFYSQN